MKITESNLVLDLTTALEANLHGLSEKHTRQMHKMVTDSVKKLSENFADLLAKEQRARAKQQRRATKKSIQNLVVKLHELLAQPAAGFALSPSTRPGALAA
jgi:hypothetical protein